MRQCTHDRKHLGTTCCFWLMQCTDNSDNITHVFASYMQPGWDECMRDQDFVMARQNEYGCLLIFFLPWVLMPQVAVLAYNYMLAKSLDDDSSYSSSFFAREIVSGPDAVVSVGGHSDDEHHSLFYLGDFYLHLGDEIKGYNMKCTP